MITSVLVLAAAALLLWPNGKSEQITLPGLPSLPLPTLPPSPAPVYPSALENLWRVRTHIEAAGNLKQPEQQAISLLTLAIVAGSTKE